MERVDLLHSKLAAGRWSFVIRSRLAGVGISEGPLVVLDIVQDQILVAGIDYPKNLAGPREE